MNVNIYLLLGFSFAAENNQFKGLGPVAFFIPIKISAQTVYIFQHSRKENS
jgi:hypothetical protein